MHFTMSVNMDNAAFDGQPETELTKILAVVIRQLIDGKVFAACMDENGNKVGSWEIVARKEW